MFSVSNKHGIKEHLCTRNAAVCASGITVTVTCHLVTALQLEKQATDEHWARGLVILC